MPNLVALTRPSLQIFGKTQTGVFPISGFMVKENYHNSRTSNVINMKLKPITKLVKINKTASKNFDHDVMSKNCDVIVIFLFMANLERSGSRIADV